MINKNKINTIIDLLNFLNNNKTCYLDTFLNKNIFTMFIKCDKETIYIKADCEKLFLFIYKKYFFYKKYIYIIDNDSDSSKNEYILLVDYFNKYIKYNNNIEYNNINRLTKKFDSLSDERKNKIKNLLIK